jgi:DNA-binding transcriptional LysR family regulator
VQINRPLTTGTTLLHAGPDGTITLTADGEQFARDVIPVLNMLARADGGHTRVAN